MTALDPIYLDYHSTTPCDPEVIDRMIPLFGKNFGNAASRQHTYGLHAAAEVNAARDKLAALINASPEEIIFTSGATESINLAIKGVAEMYKNRGGHVITSVTEHAAVIDCFRHLESLGHDVTWLTPDSTGLINAAQVQEKLRPDTILLALMWANNETGLIQPMDDLVKLANDHHVVFFSDATQALGKQSVDAENSGIGLLSFSAHKIYGPKGVGALYIRRKNPRIRITPQMDGGGHERGLRSGTLNVPGIAGFGVAAEICRHRIGEEPDRISAMRDLFESELIKEKEVWLNGSKRYRLPTVSNLCFRFTDGKLLMAELNKSLAVSSGSACSSSSDKPSHVLTALGLGHKAAEASVRFSFGRMTTDDEVQKAIDIVKNALQKTRREQYPAFDELSISGAGGGEWRHPAGSSG